jgi:hypothetical protein
MPIVTSTFSLGHAQKDGRKYSVESHTDHAGVVHQAEYLSAVSENNNAVMLARALVIAEQLKNTELNYAIFEAPWDYVLQWATNSDLSAWVRAEYKTASKDVLALIAKRILEWITNGRFTDTQVRTVFGLTSPQWTTLKGKMQTLVNNYVAVDLAVGE